MSDITLQPGVDVLPAPRKRGRPPGSRNKVSKQAQTFFQRLWNNPDFKKKFKKDWIEGKLAPQVYVAGAQYAWGKPVDQINLNTDGEQQPTAFVLIVDGKALMPGADGR